MQDTLLNSSGPVENNWLLKRVRHPDFADRQGELNLGSWKPFQPSEMPNGSGLGYCHLRDS